MDHIDITDPEQYRPKIVTSWHRVSSARNYFLIIMCAPQKTINLISLLLLLHLTSALPVLQIVVVESCIKCIHIWRSSMTYLPQLYSQIHTRHQNWTPKDSINISNGYRFEFISVKVSEERQILGRSNWMATVTNEYISLEFEKTKEEIQQELQRLVEMQLAENAVLVYLDPNSTGIQQETIYEKDKAIKWYNRSHFKENRDKVINQILKNYTEAHKRKSTQRYPQIFHRITRMCEGQLRRMLLNDYALILLSESDHHQKLINELQTQIGPECDKQHQLGLFLIGAAIVIGIILRDYMNQRKKLQTNSPV